MPTKKAAVEEAVGEIVDTAQYDVHQKLAMIQQEISVPKKHWNKFGEFHFRSCEDILTAVKPYLKKYNALLKVSDEVKLIGNWVYIEATAIFTDLDTGREIKNSASARESDIKKGMDASQLTGTASSYARKYALNGMLLLDDVKDADTDEFQKQNSETSGETPKDNRPTKTLAGPSERPISDSQKKLITDLYKDDVNSLNQQLFVLGKKTIHELSVKEASDIITKKTLKN